MYDGDQQQQQQQQQQPASSGRSGGSGLGTTSNAYPSAETLGHENRRESKESNTDVDMSHHLGNDGQHGHYLKRPGSGSNKVGPSSTQVQSSNPRSNNNKHGSNQSKPNNNTGDLATDTTGSFTDPNFSDNKTAKKPSAWSAIKSRFTACRIFGRSRPRNVQFRTVIPNNRLPTNLRKNEHPNGRYANNSIRTTKYSLLSFLPKNLFEQFHRFANLYFISVVILNWIPRIEAFGKEITMLPVVFVMSVTAIKDAFEDFRRYKSDQKINNSTCRVWHRSDDDDEDETVKTSQRNTVRLDLATGASDPGKRPHVEQLRTREEKRYMKKWWKEVLVGDWVHLSCNEKIPADILLLKSSDPAGMCYVETSNLDGESNLKQRHVLQSQTSDLQSEDPDKFMGTIQCEPPNSAIYKFNAFLLHENGEREGANKDNLLLRGCELRNTDFVEGIVIYAGHDTKSLMNNSGPRYKRSDLERLMNWDIVWCVVILLILCVVGAIGSGLWLNSFKDPNNVIYLTYTKQHPLKLELEAFINFWSYIIVLQIMIPISLYVSIEIIKLGQIFLIVQDKELYDEESDKKIQCRALNIPEELGQIQYVLSDKTGTLTENKMIFRRCAVAGVDYGGSEANPSDSNAGEGVKRKNESVEDVKANPNLLQLLAEIPSDMFNPNSGAPGVFSANQRDILDFFINMAICNTVVVATKEHHDNMNASGVMERTRGADVDNVSLAPSSRPQTPADGGGPDDDAMSVSSSVPRFPRNDSRLPPINTTQRSGTDDDQITKNQSIPEIREESDVGVGGLGGTVGDDGTKSTSGDGQSPRPTNLNVTSKSFLNLPRPWRKSRPSSAASTPATANPIYEAESPDELSLVFAARAYGVRMVKRQKAYTMVEMPDGRLQKFEVLYTLPFDSVRKRMSVVVRAQYSSKPILFSKGADAAMLELLSPEFTNSARGQNILFKSQEYINLYASYGLRTLCLCKKELTEEEFEWWSNLHKEAEQALTEREELLFESAKRIETKLELLGVTGIEDRLQDGVSSCIASLRHAGIKVWVLTGDKIETAVNIAYACRLFSYGMTLMQLCAKNEDDTRELIETNLRTLKSQQDNGNVKTKVGVVIDGRTLAFCLRSRIGPGGSSTLPRDASLRTQNEAEKRKETEEKFVQLISRCSAVLCCRATPSQKAHIVRLVKQHLEGKTLAIGDGANDVAMIQSADVGVGISGQEGMQAVMASDFAIARFKFLKRLLLVHGHWCYDRLARTVLYFFYKNALFVFVIFWFQLFCGFSSQVIIDPIYLMTYNLIFTSVPPLLLGMMDQDASEQLLMDQPRLYSVGRTNSLYKPYSFWMHMVDALWQSLVIYFVTHLIYLDSDTGLWSFGFLIFSALVIGNQLHLATEIKSWNWLLATSIVMSVIIYYVFALTYNAIPTALVENHPYWIAERMVGTPTYWLGLLFICILSILPRMTMKIIGNSLAPPVVLLARLRVLAKQQRAKPGWLARFTASPPEVAIVSETGHGVHA